MKTTPFTEKHISLGAKMHEFAGYNMPIEYSGIIDEHPSAKRNLTAATAIPPNRGSSHGTGGIFINQHWYLRREAITIHYYQEALSMRYKPKDHTLKNGVLCHLRSPLPADAAAILHLMKATSDETDFMARYSDEITMPTLREEKFLESTLSSPADLMICAVVDGTIIANAGLSQIGRASCRERVSSPV